MYTGNVPFWVRGVSVVLALMLLLLSGCGGAKPVPELAYEKGAISVEYLADPDLNLYNRKPHTVVLVIYQLDDVNAFNALAAHKQGVVELLAAKSFDKSVTSVTKKYIEPDSNGTLTIDRAAHSQHVGVVAGFYELNEEKSSLLFDLTYDTSRHGFFLKKRTTVNPLDVQLVLEADGLRIAEKDNDS